MALGIYPVVSTMPFEEGTVRLLYTLAAFSFAYVAYWGYTSRKAPNMPPGPPTFPIIGNLHQMPRARIHLKFSDWGERLDIRRGGVLT